MFTTCPACRMNLAVTATDLRVGQGYVRCGRCERVFNALMSLSEDLDPEERSGHVAHGTGTVPALEDSGSEPGSGQHGATEEPGTYPRQDADPPTDTEQPEDDDDLDVVESAESGTVETIVLEGDTYLQTEEHVDENELRERLQAMTGVHPAHVDEAEQEEIDADAAVGNPPRPHWAWGVAAALLLLVLGGQVAHHYRQELVANRWLEKPLQMIYGWFGMQLEPSWDLTAYDLRQLGGEALAADSTTIVLRASVFNRGPHPQPPPLIRVRLEDKYGNMLSSTAVAPDDYVKGPAPARMAPEQRLDVELRVEDPNRQAASWDLDACLPGLDGAPHCAHDR